MEKLKAGDVVVYDRGYLSYALLFRHKTVKEFSLAYHARWGHEELYKSIKHHIKTIEFHGKTESFIQQKIYAGFNILTLNRIMGNIIEEKFEENKEKNLQDPFQRERKINFKKQII